MNNSSFFYDKDFDSHQTNEVVYNLGLYKHVKK